MRERTRGQLADESARLARLREVVPVEAGLRMSYGSPAPLGPGKARRRRAGKFYRKTTLGGWRKNLTSKHLEAVEQIMVPLLKEFWPKRLC